MLSIRLCLEWLLTSGEIQGKCTLSFWHTLSVSEVLNQWIVFTKRQTVGKSACNKHSYIIYSPNNVSWIQNLITFELDFCMLRILSSYCGP